MSFQLLSLEPTKENTTNFDSYQSAFDILTATQICKLTKDEQILAIKESIENNEHNVVEIVSFLHESDETCQIILANQDLTLSTVYKHVAKKSLSNSFSNTYEALRLYQLPKPINKVELKKSKIHGNGVFATQVLEDGDIVTFYPIHIILIDNNVAFNDMHQENYDDYVYGIFGQISIAGIPEKCDDPTYLGHMINDGSCAKNRTIYYKYSTRSNCTFFNVVDVNTICYCVAIIATRRIEIGEELLLSYGWNYWRNR